MIRPFTFLLVSTSGRELEGIGSALIDASIGVRRRRNPYPSTSP
jgi:hypothetical protein